LLAIKKTINEKDSEITTSIRNNVFWHCKVVISELLAVMLSLKLHRATFLFYVDTFINKKLIK